MAAPGPMQLAAFCLVGAGREPCSSTVTACGTGSHLLFPGQKNQN